MQRFGDYRISTTFRFSFSGLSGDMRQIRIDIKTLSQPARRI
jgi:hypothetical protein